jgi:hypothetical protein
MIFKHITSTRPQSKANKGTPYHKLFDSLLIERRNIYKSLVNFVVLEALGGW